MTITERINLHKCGYSKEEIAALVEEEKTALIEPEQPEEKPEQPVKPEVVQPQNTEILKAITDLTAAIQAQNLQRAKQDAPEIKTAEDVLVGALKNL